MILWVPSYVTSGQRGIRMSVELSARRGYRPSYSLLMVKIVKTDLPPNAGAGRASRSASRRSTRVSAKHQVTIPATAFEGAGLVVGDRLEAKPLGAGKVLLERVESSVGRYAGVLTGVWDKDELERLRDEWD